MSLRFYKSRIKSHNAFCVSRSFPLLTFFGTIKSPPKIHILNCISISYNFYIKPLIMRTAIIASDYISKILFNIKMKNIKIFPLSSLYEVLIIQSVRSRYVYWTLLMINYPFLNSARKMGIAGVGVGTFYNRRSSLNLHDSPISYVLPFLVIDKRDDIFINDLPSMIMIVIITILTFSRELL